MAKIVFTGANLLDGEHPAKPDSSVAVEGDRIVAVTTGSVRAGAGDRVIDCGGRTLMPGMVSGHFHSTYRDIDLHREPLGLESPPAYQAYVAADNARLALRAGVTSVVGAGEAFDIDPSLRDAIRAGLIAGPRVIAGSRALITTADSNDSTPWWWESAALHGVRICDGPDEFRRAVRDEIRRGAEVVKLFPTGGHGSRLSAKMSTLTRAELNAAVEVAHDLGKRVRAHVCSKAGIIACLEAGVDIVDHGDGLDDECMKAMAETGTFLVPSLHLGARMMERLGASVASEGPRAELLGAFRTLCEILPRAVDLGVRVCLGDDYGSELLPHGEYGKEPAVCVKYASISPLEALRWATVNGGALAGVADLGGIEKGALADMLVINGDPSVDIDLLGDVSNICGVMHDGELLLDNLA